MERKEGLVVGAALALILYTVILSAFGPMISSTLTSRTISNVGSVKAVGVGVYWDQASTNSVTLIDWGVVAPGSNVSKTVYIRNEGNAAARLAMATSNWSPSNASSCMSLSWSYGSQTLNAGEVVQVTLTLSVSANITGITGFSFDIIITASE